MRHRVAGRGGALTRPGGREPDRHQSFHGSHDPEDVLCGNVQSECASYYDADDADPSPDPSPGPSPASGGGDPSTVPPPLADRSRSPACGRDSVTPPVSPAARGGGGGSPSAAPGAGSAAPRTPSCETCTACRSLADDAPGFITNDHAARISYISTHFPDSDHKRLYASVRQACVRRCGPRAGRRLCVRPVRP